MASTTPTAHFFVEWAAVHLYLPVLVLFVHFVRNISAKDFPNGRNLRKTAPSVAREGCRTLILISCCKDVVLIRNQPEYRD